MSARDLTALAEHFGIASATMRVALSRMASAGDLVLTDATYTLASRHLERQVATEALIRPRCRPYDGMWRMAVVVDRGRPAADRTALRAQMARRRFAELREGVWLRPDNLVEGTASNHAEMRIFTTLAQDDRQLCRELWDLDAWAVRARRLLEAIRDEGRPVDRLAAAAAAVRHLCTDPALPVELAPERWPADELRWAYDDYRAELNDTYLAGTTAQPRTEPSKESHDHP
jgi:phenylacetic acid degradation operon negative regulatory protein